MRLPLEKQTVKFIPILEITNSQVDVLIYNKSKRDLVFELKDLNTNVVSHFNEVAFDVLLKEGENYIIEIYTLNLLVYRGLAFATAQTETYSINEGNYKEHASNNEYIILDND